MLRLLSICLLVYLTSYTRTAAAHTIHSLGPSKIDSKSATVALVVGPTSLRPQFVIALATDGIDNNEVGGDTGVS